MIAGSIGIGHILNELGEISTINDFEQVRLDPFSPRVASSFLSELASSHGIGISPACKRRMLQLIGTAVPYFLQVMFSEVSKATAQDGTSVNPKMVERIYHEKVLGVDCMTYFDHYYGRLRDYYKPHEEKAAKRILCELAVAGSLTRDFCSQLYKGEVVAPSSTESFNRLMTELENDFYISFNSGTRRYDFACKLLRDWWLRHYGMEAGDPE